MRQWLALVGCLVCVVACGPVRSAKPSAAEPLKPGRDFELTHEVLIGPLPRGDVDVFVPLASTGPGQHVSRMDIQATLPGVELVEGRYGNRFWHGYGHREQIGKFASVTVRYVARRFQNDVDLAAARPLTDAERRSLAMYLRPVAVQGRWKQFVEEAAGQPGTDVDWASVLEAWGKVRSGGDDGPGQCVQAHRPLVALSRARGIPARLESGFAVGVDKHSGDLPGATCWVGVYLGGLGWVPLGPEFGGGASAPASVVRAPDRFRIGHGSQLSLGVGHRSEPLATFGAPYAEHAGKALDLVRTNVFFSDGSGEATATAP